MITRESAEKDKDRIYDLHRTAFGETEGPAVAKLTLELLADKTAQPFLSLLAEDDANPVGHVLFTPVRIRGASAAGAYILAPLAVAPGHQGRGIGTALIHRGLEILRERAAVFVLVLGDPKYYSRVGFLPDHNIRPPYPIDYPEAWMAQELKEGVLNGISGTVQCAAPLHSREHW